MAREILFKAKSIDGEWVEGSYLFCPIRDNEKSELENITYKHWIVSKDGMCYEIDINTLCQYTGLTDKNGNKIWENDVVKGIYGTYEGRYIIVWWNDEAKFSFPTIAKVDTSKYEVIGNIFDNPELLRGGADNG